MVKSKTGQHEGGLHLRGNLTLPLVLLVAYLMALLMLPVEIR